MRNCTRPRTLTTTSGDLDLRIPKLRAGSFSPSLLERRRRIDKAMSAVVMEAYLHGVSTRKVDDVVRALGADTGTRRGPARLGAYTEPTSACSRALAIHCGIVRARSSNPSARASPGKPAESSQVESVVVHVGAILVVGFRL